MPVIQTQITKIAFYDLDDTLVDSSTAIIFERLEPLNPRVFRQFEKDRKNPSIRTEILSCRLRKKNRIKQKFKVKVNLLKFGKRCVKFKTEFLNRIATYNKNKQIELTDNIIFSFDPLKLKKNIVIKDPHSRKTIRGKL